MGEFIRLNLNINAETAKRILELNYFNNTVNIGTVVYTYFISKI